MFMRTIIILLEYQEIKFQPHDFIPSLVHLLYFGSLIYLNVLNILKKDLEYFKTSLT